MGQTKALVAKKRGRKPVIKVGAALMETKQVVEITLPIVMDEVENPFDNFRERIKEEKRGEWASDYLNGKTTCPRCQCQKPYTRTTRPSEGGLKIRYHACPICKVRFKSIEIVIS
jgi:hypothetical protein